MGKINLGRVILGGIAAGILIDLLEGILNGVLLQKQWIAVMTGLGKSSTMSVKQIVAFNLWGLAAGILMVWLYAGIRARLGPVRRPQCWRALRCGSWRTGWGLPVLYSCTFIRSAWR